MHWSSPDADGMISEHHYDPTAPPPDHLHCFSASLDHSPEDMADARSDEHGQGAPERHSNDRRRHGRAAGLRSSSPQGGQRQERRRAHGVDNQVLRDDLSHPRGAAAPKRTRLGSATDPRRDAGGSFLPLVKGRGDLAPRTVGRHAQISFRNRISALGRLQLRCAVGAATGDSGRLHDGYLLWRKGFRPLSLAGRCERSEGQSLDRGAKQRAQVPMPMAAPSSMEWLQANSRRGP